MPVPRRLKAIPCSTIKEQTRDECTVEQRAQPRFTTQFRSHFSGGRIEGQGRTIDISLGGCRIESETSMPPGSRLECRLHIPGFDWPLRVDEALVRWVKGKTFGVSFIRMHADEQAKLKTVIQDLDRDA